MLLDHMERCMFNIKLSIIKKLFSLYLSVSALLSLRSALDLKSKKIKKTISNVTLKRKQNSKNNKTRSSKTN